MPGGAFQFYLFYCSGVNVLFRKEGKWQIKRNQRLVSYFGSGVQDLAGCISGRVYGWTAIKKEDRHGKKIK